MQSVDSKIVRRTGVLYHREYPPPVITVSPFGIIIPVTTSPEFNCMVCSIVLGALKGMASLFGI